MHGAKIYLIKPLKLFATDEEMAVKCQKCGKTWGEHVPLTNLNQYTACRFRPVKEET